ncbi:MAG: hypothetical protein F6K32_26380 [Desertifilum sp. SIO1I2]|nr:hypothetical protein [Desertifilum sp. SIO1I2]
MAYSDFKTLNQVLTAFCLKLVNQFGLFSQVNAIAPSAKLSEQIAENFDLALAIDTEKARSELIVTPILLEVYRRFSPNLSLFSGVALSVDATQGLNGECDFILSASTNQLEVSTPVLTLVEAKNNDIKSGLGQCAAQLVGAQRFNESQQKTVPIYGAVTTGAAWRFMRLQSSQLEVDLTEYFVPPQIANVLGILCQPFLAEENPKP